MAVRTVVVAAVILLLGTVALADPVPDKPLDNVINLDLAPEMRWTTAINQLLDKQGWDVRVAVGALALVSGFSLLLLAYLSNPHPHHPPHARFSLLPFRVQHSYKPIVDFINDFGPWSKKLIDDLDPILSALVPSFGEYGKEIKGIFDVLNARYPGKMTLGRLVLLNIFYDVTAGCTSVVGSSTDPSFCSSSSCAGPQGVLMHGRNLDFPIPGLPNITSVVHFAKGGNVAVRGVTYLGYVGLLTGYRVGGWSVSVDERDKHYWVNATSLPIVDNVISFLLGGQSLGTTLRTYLNTIPSYDKALLALNTTRFVSPVYLIVGGLTGNEGAVITRNREGADMSGGLQNGVWSIQRGDGSWFRAQTNDDHWLAPRDNRRATINAAMAQVGPGKLNLQSFLGAMRTPDILNEDTTFVSVMSPAYDIMYAEVTNRFSTAPINWKHFGGKGGIRRQE